jgi:hypothetical protein
MHQLKFDRLPIGCGWMTRPDSLRTEHSYEYNRGNRDTGVGGEGSPANRTPLNGPVALAIDTVGNLYIAEAASNRVRMVGSDGLIRTIVGNGSTGHDGDDGPAASAQIVSPQCLAVGPSGALQICDSDRIRKLVRLRQAGGGFQPGA